MISVQQSWLLLFFLLLSVIGIRVFLSNLHRRDSTKQELPEYHTTRDFSKAPGTKGSRDQYSGEKKLFVVQQHHASQNHYDLRLEMDGILKSWAVPKGPSLNPQDKRLATLTDDHSLEYASFEGIIAEGYGKGTVILWDTGSYENITQKDGKKISMDQAFNNGHIKIMVYGQKLQGAYALTRFKEKDWLLVKVNDEYADAQSDIVKEKPESVISKMTIEELDKKFEG